MLITQKYEVETQTVAEMREESKINKELILENKRERNLKQKFKETVLTRLGKQRAPNEILQE